MPETVEVAMNIPVADRIRAAAADLAAHGWALRDPLAVSRTLDSYRAYIQRSRGEFSIAKHAYVVSRSGWFSDRSATYLAAGRPVVTQETGFSNVLPTGRGLFAFSNMDEALASIESINSDYAAHRKAASEIAREYFSHEVVLTKLLSEVGLGRRSPRAKSKESEDISVNIVGDLGGHTGMSVTVERYARALESIGAKVTLIDPAKETTCVAMPSTVTSSLYLTRSSSRIVNSSSYWRDHAWELLRC